MRLPGWSRPQAGTLLETGGSLAAVAIGTPLPLGSILKIFAEVAGLDSGAAKQWEKAFVSAVRHWIAQEPAVGQLDGPPMADWDTRLMKEFNERGAAAFLGSQAQAREVAVDVVARAMFTPHTKFGWDASHAAADAFLEALPDLLLNSAGEHGELASLNTVVGRELQQVLDAVDALSTRLPPRMGDRLAVETYITAMAAVLDSDRWAVLVGGPNQTLEASFEARRVHRRGFDESLEVEAVADASERLVLLGEPGLGKSWVARHLAIRAAAAALAVDDEPEIPLIAPVAAVLDAAPDIAPWEAVVRTAVDGLSEFVGTGGVNALRARLDRHGGRYLVVLDGLDEATHSADAERLERLAATPGRDVRLVLTSRPGAWRRQLELDPVSPSHALVELEPLNAEAVRSTIGRLLADKPEPRATLLDVLDRDAQLAELARTPLICVMLCAAVSATGQVPRGRTRLFAAVVTLLLQATWHAELSEPAVVQAHAALVRAAADAAADDPATGLGRWPPTVALDVAGLSTESLDAADNVAPVADPNSRPPRPRRFIHESVRAHLVAEAVAGLGPAEAALRLRDHLWFDGDWDEVVPSALALHPDRGELLRRLLDVGDDRAPAWEDVVRLDGFGELRALLRALALETEAADWPSPCRELILRVAHDGLRRHRQAPGRLELVRGGWPDDRTRDEHLAALAAGEPWWPLADLPAGIESLALSAVERRDVATRLARHLASGEAQDDAAAVLTALCAPGLESELDAAAAGLTERLEEAVTFDRIGALAALPFTPEQGRRAAAAILAWIESIDTASTMAVVVGELLARVPRFTDDAAVLDRASSAALAYITTYPGFDTLDTLAHGVTTSLLRRDPAACAAALRQVLMSMKGADSYRTGQLARWGERLVPASEDAPVVLAALLDQPVAGWPDWDVTVSVLVRLASGRESTLAASVAGRFGDAPLADLQRLPGLLDRLDPDPDLRAAAAATLVARMAATPHGILDCAEALRALRPPAELRARAADLLHDRLQEADDAGLRASLAIAVLWFASTNEARKPAVDELISQLPSASDWLVHDIERWARGDDVTREERSCAFDAFVDLLRERRVTGVADTLAALASDEQQRAKAVDVLLHRLRVESARHPSDWLDKAAALGATREQIAAANDLVIAALPEMALSQGGCMALERTWELAPLTGEQRTRAARRLVDLLEHGERSYLDHVCGLLLALRPDAATVEAAKAALRPRADGATAGYDAACNAMRRLEPGYGEPTAADLLEELEINFHLETATLLSAASPDEPVRRRAVELLIAWATPETRYFYADRIERLADDLGLTIADLARVGRDDSAAVRALARSARRRCDGEAWRAFLRGAADPATAPAAG